MKVRAFKKNDCYYTIKILGYTDEFYSPATKEDRGYFTCRFIAGEVSPFGVIEITEQLSSKKLFFDLEGNVHLSKNAEIPIFNTKTDSIN